MCTIYAKCMRERERETRDWATPHAYCNNNLRFPIIFESISFWIKIKPHVQTLPSSKRCEIYFNENREEILNEQSNKFTHHCFHYECNRMCIIIIHCSLWLSISVTSKFWALWKSLNFSTSALDVFKMRILVYCNYKMFFKVLNANPSCSLNPPDSPKSCKFVIYFIFFRVWKILKNKNRIWIYGRSPIVLLHYHTIFMWKMREKRLRPRSKPPTECLPSHIEPKKASWL